MPPKAGTRRVRGSGDDDAPAGAPTNAAKPDPLIGDPHRGDSAIVVFVQTHLALIQFIHPALHGLELGPRRLSPGGSLIDTGGQPCHTLVDRLHPGPAGLHLTEDLLQKIRQAGVALVSVTLHVGLGTFRPVSAKRLDDHKMHSEYAQIAANVVRRLQASKSEGGRILAVGTTSVRTLESAALQGGGSLVEWAGQTDLFIRPGFRFQAVDRLLTNFHLPRSTLLVLVSSLAGRELMLEAYRKAVEERYRFFSYGDCMLIL
jgi:hypothetical protein